MIKVYECLTPEMKWIEKDTRPIWILFFLFPKGTILGAFYYGYTAMQIPGGWLGQRFGGTRVFGICLGIASILTMLTPIAARTSVAALITLRVIEGLALVSEQITGCFLQANKHRDNLQCRWIIFLRRSMQLMVLVFSIIAYYAGF